MLTNALLIARKDFRQYFFSPIAYIVITVFMILIGWFFFLFIDQFVQMSSRYDAVSFGLKPSISEHIFQPLISNMNVVLLFVIPFITMRLLAEERRDQTVQLLFTAPVHPFSIILGKYLSALGLVSVMIALTFIYPLILILSGKPDVGVMVSGYLGLFFLAGTYISIGLFWSSITENQIVAAALTFGSLLSLFLISWAANQASPGWKLALDAVSLLAHFQNFMRGVISTADLVYFFSCIAFPLFGTYTAFDANQWSSSR